MRLDSSKLKRFAQHAVVACTLPAFLLTQFAWSLPAFALRQNQLETQEQRSGLEEALQEDNPQLVQLVASTPAAAAPLPALPAARTGPRPVQQDQAGLEKITPGDGKSANPIDKVRTDVVQFMQQEFQFSERLAPLLAGFLEGKYTFDEARELLVKLSADYPPVLSHDQTRDLLFQVWMAARFQLNFDQTMRLRAAQKDSVRRMTIEGELKDALGQNLRDDEIVAIVREADRLGKLAGYTVQNPWAGPFSEMARKVEDAIGRADWGDSVVKATALFLPKAQRSVIEIFALFPEVQPGKLALFSIFASPGRRQLQMPQLVKLAQIVLWTMDPFAVARPHPPPPIKEEWLRSGLPATVLEWFNEPIPEEILQEAFFEGKTHAAILNLAAIGGLALADALQRAIPEEDRSPEASYYREIARALRWDVLFNVLEIYKQGTPLGSPWKEKALSAYRQERLLDRSQAINEVTEIALTHRFEQLVLSPDGKQMSPPLLLPVDPPDQGEQTIRTLFDQWLPATSQDPREPSVLLKVRPFPHMTLVVSPHIEKKPDAAGLEAGVQNVLLYADDVRERPFAMEMSSGWMRETGRHPHQTVIAGPNDREAFLNQKSPLRLQIKKQWDAVVVVVTRLDSPAISFIEEINPSGASKPPLPIVVYSQTKDLGVGSALSRLKSRGQIVHYADSETDLIRLFTFLDDRVRKQSAAGLEGTRLREVVERLAEIAERNAGVLVITQSGLEEHPELMKLARHPEFAKRMIVYGAVAAAAQLAQLKEFGVRVIDENDFSGLVIALLSMEKAVRVNVLEEAGTLTQALAKVLPPSMRVIHIAIGARIKAILSAFIPEEEMDQFDPEALGTLARLTAA